MNTSSVPNQGIYRKCPESPYISTDQLRTGDHWDTGADEFIRLAPPTMHFRRTLTQDYELHGKTMKKGDKALLWFVSGSRDEAVFDDPHACQLGRQPNRHLAFGQGGIHVCLGMHLGKLEVRIAIKELVKRVDVFETIEAPTWTRSNFICGVNKLPLQPAEDLDGWENVREKRHVPSGLDKSLDALDRDVELRKAIGELDCDALLYLKRDEFKRSIGRSVDDVRDSYLPFI